MTDKDKKQELTAEEIEAQGGEELPDREEMSLIGSTLVSSGAPIFLGPPTSGSDPPGFVGPPEQVPPTTT